MADIRQTPLHQVERVEGEPLLWGHVYGGGGSITLFKGYVIRAGVIIILQKHHVIMVESSIIYLSKTNIT